MSYFELDYSGNVYRIHIKRSVQTRRYSLRVRSSHSPILLTIPQRASLSHARDFAVQHVHWIEERLRALPQRVPFIYGSVIPIRGQWCRLVGVPEQLVRVQMCLEQSPGHLYIGGCAKYCAQYVKDFLKKEALSDIQQAVQKYANKLGVTFSRLTLRDSRTRWGSCSAHGSLNFSWRLVMAPPFVLDYLCAHEVTHLRHMDHSQLYWETLENLCPSTQEAERWLKKHGRDLHLYGENGCAPP